MSLAQNDSEVVASSGAFEVDTAAKDSTRTLLICLWSLAVGLGGIHAWADRYSMNADGISYLDMADALLQGDWNAAVNGYWSPLYPLFLGAALFILKPNAYWEFPIIHLVNFEIYLAALACFHFLLRELMTYHQRTIQKGSVTFDASVWYSFGYSLFIWSSLTMTPLSLVTPDLCVAAFVFLASGILLRIRGGSANWFTFTLFGMVLGFGYLSKASMFPMAFVFLAVGMLSLRNIKRAIPLGLLALFVFLFISGPFLVALSISKGRLSFGDSGRLAYVRMVNGAAGRHWQGTWPPGLGTPKHPTRKIFDVPAIYEFGNPIRGTYPPWYDPSYWYDGATPRFDWRRQIIVFASNLQEFLAFFLSSQSGLLAGFLILFSMSRTSLSSIRDIAQQWILLVPATAGIAMYLPVYIEPRYFGPFLILFWLGIASAVHLSGSWRSTRLISTTSAVMVSIMMVVVGVLTAPKALTTTYELLKGVDPSVHVHWKVAEGLKQLGVQPGDNVGVIGQGAHHFYAHWARLARVRIVAEIISKEVSEFVASDPEVRVKASEAFTRAGARVLVADHLPSRLMHEGWQRIGKTQYFVYLLSGSVRKER